MHFEIVCASRIMVLCLCGFGYGLLSIWYFIAPKYAFIVCPIQRNNSLFLWILLVFVFFAQFYRISSFVMKVTLWIHLFVHYELRVECRYSMQCHKYSLAFLHITLNWSFDKSCQLSIVLLSLVSWRLSMNRVCNKRNGQFVRNNECS